MEDKNTTSFHANEPVPVMLIFEFVFIFFSTGEASGFNLTKFNNILFQPTGSNRLICSVSRL